MQSRRQIDVEGKELTGENPLDDEEERNILYAALDSFRQYRRKSHYNVTHRRRKNLYALPRQSWSMLAADPIKILDKLSAVDDAIDDNADLADAIFELGLQMFAPALYDTGDVETLLVNTAKPNDLHKVHSTIRQLYRDWTREGFTAEVEPILNLVLQDLQEILPKPSASDHPQILLPGAGLGRLLFELCVRGYNVEGNEISYHQLLTSNFVLNSTQRPAQYKIYPFATTFTNQISLRNQLKEAWMPDVHPATALSEVRQMHVDESTTPPGEMNMAAGDFLTSYAGDNSRGIYDVVLTVYFIDTAPNLLRYIETIRHCLREGGFWINSGPLLWHFDDRTTDTELDTAEDSRSSSAQNGFVADTGIAEPGSFELTDEEVLDLVGRMGFEFVKHEYLSESIGGYIQDPNSMIQSRYRCSHWVARKLASK